MKPPKIYHSAFSLVELLIVLIIITVLMTLVLFAISGIKNTANTSKIQNNLRQVALAWQQYAYANKENLIPGLLDPGTQKKWKIEFPDPFGNNLILPPYPNFGEGDTNIAGLWPSRIASHLGNTTLLSFHDKNWIRNDIFEQSLKWASMPTFALNGYYLGGIWSIRNDKPSFLYKNSKTIDEKPYQVVTKKYSQIKRPDSILSFVPAGLLDPGNHDTYNKNITHTALATPRLLASRQTWTYATSNHNVIVEIAANGVPFSMGLHKIPYSMAGGSVHSASPHKLNNQALWIPRAKQVESVPPFDFTHLEN